MNKAPAANATEAKINRAANSLDNSCAKFS